jgi:hypothetical protein
MRCNVKNEKPPKPRLGSFEGFFRGGYIHPKGRISISFIIGTSGSLSGTA